MSISAVASLSRCLSRCFCLAKSVFNFANIPPVLFCGIMLGSVIDLRIPDSLSSPSCSGSSESKSGNDCGPSAAASAAVRAGIACSGKPGLLTTTAGLDLERRDWASMSFPEGATSPSSDDRFFQYEMQQETRSATRMIKTIAPTPAPVQKGRAFKDCLRRERSLSRSSPMMIQLVVLIPRNPAAGVAVAVPFVAVVGALLLL